MLEITLNECREAAYLNAAGHSQEAITEYLDVHHNTVGVHRLGECSCPDLDEPQPILGIDGDEFRAARKAAGLTQPTRWPSVGHLWMKTHYRALGLSRGLKKPERGLCWSPQTVISFDSRAE
jgi:hypothetical protein